LRLLISYALRTTSAIEQFGLTTQIQLVKA
jgi:hypothetical protein